MQWLDVLCAEEPELYDLVFAMVTRHRRRSKLVAVARMARAHLYATLQRGEVYRSAVAIAAD